MKVSYIKSHRIDSSPESASSYKLCFSQSSLSFEYNSVRIMILVVTVVILVLAIMVRVRVRLGLSLFTESDEKDGAIERSCVKLRPIG